MNLVAAVGPWTRLCKMRWLAKHKFFRTSSRLKFATGFNYFQLKWIFYVLRIVNLFSIIFSMIMVERTLQYNHIESVLGSNGRIFFPSQLLPFTIGLCSLVRVMYLRFEMWRSPEDIKPSLADNQSLPTRAATTPRGKRWLKVFAPRTQIEGASSIARRTFENSDVDPDMRDQATWWRYLVAWSPWLYAVSYWFKEQKEEYGNIATTKARTEDVESMMRPRMRNLRGPRTFESEDTLQGRKQSEVHSIKK